MRRTDRYRYPVIMTLLILLHFRWQPSRWGPLAPDFLLLGCYLHDRAEPGKSAAAGFVLACCAMR